MVNWPETLPKSFQQSSYSKSRDSNVVQTDMDSGPPRSRRLFTSAIKHHGGSMIMNQTQINIFETFFESTILSGTLPFTFPNPLNLSQNIEVFFDDANPPYKITPDGGTLDWVVSFSIREIP